MQKVIFIIILFLRFIPSPFGRGEEGAAFAQPAEYKITRPEYIEKYKDIAIREMQEHGIPASVTLAQGLLESDAGNSALAVYANNHFGIKCHKDWTGKTYIKDDDRRDECFRKYNHAEESFDDHSEFLRERNRYSFLFELRKTDYKGWAEGLKEAGYATDPGYAKRLIKIIDDYKLFQYDRIQETAVRKYEKKRTEPKITPPTVAEFSASRKVFLNNDIKYVVVKEGDTYYKIAHDFEMRLWQLHNYNETGRQTCLQAGDMVYLQPKRRHSRAENTHVVRFGETMYEISQLYGIKTRHLYKLNNMQEGQEPKAGQKIWLKTHK